MKKLFVKDEEAYEGMNVTTLQGESATLLSWSAPGERSSGGRVYIKIAGAMPQEYFPSVIDGKFIECD